MMFRALLRSAMALCRNRIERGKPFRRLLCHGYAPLPEETAGMLNIYLSTTLLVLTVPSVSVAFFTYSPLPGWLTVRPDMS